MTLLDCKRNNVSTANDDRCICVDSEPHQDRQRLGHLVRKLRRVKRQLFLQHMKDESIVSDSGEDASGTLSTLPSVIVTTSEPPTDVASANLTNRAPRCQFGIDSRVVGGNVLQSSHDDERQELVQIATRLRRAKRRLFLRHAKGPQEVVTGKSSDFSQPTSVGGRGFAGNPTRMRRSMKRIQPVLM